MEKKTFSTRGVVHLIGDLVHISRKGLPDLYKKVLTVETLDGQTFFPELRNKKLKELEQQGIEEKSIVEIEFTFQGSEKNGKRYNNIYIDSITKVH